MGTNNISFTATDVRPVGPYLSVRVSAGGTIYAGMPVYIDSSGNAITADVDGSSLSAVVLGVAIADNDGGTCFVSGNVIDVVYQGRVTGYASMTPGLPVYASTLAGQMQQTESFGTGDYLTEVGVAVTASEILVRPVRLNSTGEFVTHS